MHEECKSYDELVSCIKDEGMDDDTLSFQEGGIPRTFAQRTLRSVDFFALWLRKGLQSVSISFINLYGCNIPGGLKTRKTIMYIATYISMYG